MYLKKAKDPGSKIQMAESFAEWLAIPVGAFEMRL